MPFGYARRPLLALGLPLAFLAMLGCSHTARLGERVAMSDFAITVRGVTFYEELTDERGGTLKPKGDHSLFAAVDVLVENLKAGATPIREIDFSLVPSDHSQPIHPTILQSWPNDLRQLLTKPVPAGTPLTGNVVFVVSEGQSLALLKYKGAGSMQVSLGAMMPTAPVRRPLAKVGQVASDGGIQFTVNSVSFPEALTDKFFTAKAKPGQKLCFMDVTVKNIDREPTFTVNSLDLILEDTSKHHFNHEGLDLGFSNPLPLVKLKPGESTTGKVLVSVPQESTIQSCIYRIGVLGPPLTVSLK
jgi:hypothetical protein